MGREHEEIAALRLGRPRARPKPDVLDLLMQHLNPTSRSESVQFSLPGVDGKYHSLSSLAGQTATAVVFVANGCPTARAYEERLMVLQDGHRSDGVRVAAINANNPHSGRIDDSRVGDKITSRDLENALVDLVAGRPVAVRRTDPFGCGIVW